MQNISTDDLPDSASQTAQQHDSKFSFRSESGRFGHRSACVQPPVLKVVVSFSDAKKKLRLALCSADSVALPIMAPAAARNGLPDHMESEGGPVP